MTEDHHEAVWFPLRTQSGDGGSVDNSIQSEKISDRFHKTKEQQLIKRNAHHADHCKIQYWRYAPERDEIENREKH